MAPAENQEKKGSPPLSEGDSGKDELAERAEREFLPDPRRAATAITQAKKRLARPSMPGREPPE